MEVGPLCVLAIFAFAASFAGGAVVPQFDGCNEVEVRTCLKIYGRIRGEQADQQHDDSAAISFFCSHQTNPCTSMYVKASCPEEKKKELVLTEEATFAIFDVLCVNDATLLKELVLIKDCWNSETFGNCTKHRFTTKPPAGRSGMEAVLFTCVQEARNKAKECDAVSILPALKWVDAYLNKLVSIAGKN
ncbi:uncharacterized protein LOC144124653 [Amblyomma americanum]